MYESWIWLFATIGGPVVLAIAIAYAVHRNRKMSRATFEQGERATKRIYEEDQSKT